MKKRWTRKLGFALGMGLLLGLMFSMNVWAAEEDTLVEDQWSSGVSQLTDYSTPGVENLKQTSVKSGYINISFDRPANIPDGDVKYYILKSLYTEPEFPAEPDKIVVSSASSVSVSVKVTNGQMYDIRVIPYAQGSSSGYSRTLYSCRSLPAKAAVETQASYPSTNKYVLTCKRQQAASGYRAVIYGLNGKKIKTYTSTGTSGYFNMAVNSKSFYKVVLNAYAKVNGKNYYGASRTIYIAQQTNYGKAYKTGSNTAKVSWKAVSGATGYRVYYSTNYKKGYKKLATIKGTTYNLKGLVPGKTYYVVIRPEKKVGATTYVSPYTWNYGFVYR